MIKPSAFLAWVALAVSTQINAQEVIAKDTTPEWVVITYTRGNIDDALQNESLLTLDSLNFQKQILDTLTKNIKDNDMLHVYEAIMTIYPDYETYTTTKQNQIFIDFVQAYPYIPWSYPKTEQEK
jgi:hypothetical protein